MESTSIASEAMQGLWTQVTPVANTGMLRSVIFARGNFFAAGGNGLTTSTQLIGGGDSGTNWVKLKNVIADNSTWRVNKLCWNGIGSQLVALSKLGSLTLGSTYTPSGNWTSKTKTFGASEDLQDAIDYDSINGPFNCSLVVGSGGKVYCCYQDWSGRVARATTFTTSETAYCVNTIGAFLVVAGSDGKLFTAVKMLPSNPQTFTARASTFGSSDILSMKLCNGRLFIVGENGKMAYSDNALLWTAVADTSFAGTVIRDIAYGDGKYVAVGDGGKTAVSDDGINWVQQVNTFDGTDLRSVAYGNGNFVAVGDGGKIGYWAP